MSNPSGQCNLGNIQFIGTINWCDSTNCKLCICRIHHLSNWWCWSDGGCCLAGLWLQKKHSGSIRQELETLEQNSGLGHHLENRCDISNTLFLSNQWVRQNKDIKAIWLLFNWWVLPQNLLDKQILVSEGCYWPSAGKNLAWPAHCNCKTFTHRHRFRLPKNDVWFPNVIERPSSGSITTASLQSPLMWRIWQGSQSLLGVGQNLERVWSQTIMRAHRLKKSSSYE